MASYLDSTVVLNRGDVDATGAANYPAKSQNTPDDLVTQLQCELKAFGYLMGAVDGDFGERTEKALKQFQRDRKLKDDGEVGPKTRVALRKARHQEQTRDERLTYDALRADVTSLQFGWDDDPLYINLVGVRGFWHGEQVTNDFNAYNDTIVALWADKGKAKHAEPFEASCDPGRMQKPTANGVAHLMEGQYLFSKGLHKGQYPALRQASAVRVKRFFDDDPNRLQPTLDEGFFGINIHCGGISNEINDWSAGCQIVKGGRKGAPWQRFDEIVYRLAAPAQVRFRYTLLRSDSLINS